MIHDVSLRISPDLLVWPGDPPAEVRRKLKMEEGDPANVSEITMGTHTGTHVDPPNHFVPGTHGIDQVPLDVLFGPAVVVHLPDANAPLGPDELDTAVPAGAERVLLRTSNSDLWRQTRPSFPDTYACLSLEGARWVVERGIRLVGVDFLSVEAKESPGHPVHVELLSNDVVIVEGLDLGGVEAGDYTLAVLPLRIVDGDGGPARAILLSPD